MTLLKPTPDELRDSHVAREKMLQEREERWQKQRRKFVSLMAIAGGVILTITCPIGGGASLLSLPILLAGGAVSAWLIAVSGLGVLLGMVVYGSGSVATWILCCFIGCWHVHGITMLIFFVILLWLVIGGVMGLISNQYDTDHLQI